MHSMRLEESNKDLATRGLYLSKGVRRPMIFGGQGPFSLLIALGLLGCAGSAPSESPPKPTAADTLTAEAAPSSSPPKAADTAAVDTPVEREDDGPRIGSIRFRTWIWGTPMRSKNHIAIGAVRVGTSVRLKSKEPVPGQGCNDKWYAVEPRGFICSDDTTTMDLDTPYWKALREQRPKKGAWPYRYAFSTGAPMYSRVPTPEEQKSAELDLGPVGTFKTLGKWSEGHEKLVATDKESAIVADGPPPSFFHGTKGVDGSPWNPTQPRVKIIPAGSGFGYTRVFQAEGRLWVLTPDLFLVPADRVFPYKQSTFHGVELGGEKTLPIAWVRATDGAPKLTKNSDGSFAASAQRWPAKSPLFLTGDHASKGKIDLWEVKGGGYIADDDAVSIAIAATQLKHDIGEKDRWIEASILNGTMIAYDGLEPKYATMWSPGLGGVGVKGNSSKKFATTEVGIFPIQWKDAVETMSPDAGAPTVFWFADVPHIQYVHAPMAMHVAFWHESFGYPMSAECLNVSPEDGDWLFGFTEPKLPEGWGSVGSSKANGTGTKINIVP